MKRTHIIIAMLAATLLGTHTFAAAEGTILEGGSWDGNKRYYGRDSERNKVSIYSGGTKDCSDVEVYASFITSSFHKLEVSSVEMTGGTVKRICAALRNDDVEKAFVTISGGTVKEGVIGGKSEEGSVIAGFVSVSQGSRVEGNVIGGEASSGDVRVGSVHVSGSSITGNIVGGVSSLGEVSGSVIRLSGGSSITGNVVGGVSEEGPSCSHSITVAWATIKGDVVLAQAGSGASAQGNNLILVGKGCTVDSETGGSITIEGNILVKGGSVEKNTGNSIDIYGTDITAGSVMGIQNLNFHIVKEQMDPANAGAMLTLTSTSAAQALDLSNFLSCNEIDENGHSKDFSLNFDAMDGLDWQPGQSVTLVSSALELTVNPELLNKKYDIKKHDTDTVTARVALELSEDKKQLRLVCYDNIPEPATGTLGLLALAGLCIRRRKK